MGSQASKQIKQFPKASPTSSSPSPSPSPHRPFVGEQHTNESVHKETNTEDKSNVSNTSGVELTEEEIKMEQEQEKEMREYLNTLQGLTGSIQQQTDPNQNQMMFPEGVKFVKTYKEEKELQKEIDHTQQEHDKKYRNRLEKSELMELFKLHKQDPNLWTCDALAEKYKQNPLAMQQTLEYFSPVLQNVKQNENRNKHRKA